MSPPDHLPAGDDATKAAFPEGREPFRSPQRGLGVAALSPWPGAAAAALVLAAIAAGGAAERGAQGLTVCAMGLLLLAAPPTRWPPRKLLIVGAAMLALALVALLPARWFGPAAWRTAVEGVGIVLPGSLSPQPRLTLEGLAFLAAGLLWLGWLTARPWSAPTRRAAATIFAGGVIALASVMLVAWGAGWRVPGWLSEQGFAPFPNRNHTGHVLALGGALAAGCGADALRRGVRQAWMWLLGCVVILAALAINFSRGGVLLFFGALVLWTAAIAWNQRSWKILALGLAGAIAAASAVLLFGGPIAGRFAAPVEEGLAGFRGRIWSDTWTLIGAGPWCGLGLGNFQALFPFYRSASVIQKAVLHPESDWLWLAAEAGWLAVLAALTMLALLVRGALPLTRGTQQRLRGAALGAGLAAALHGVLDVPGHRLGSALAALLVFGLAQRSREPRLPLRGVALGWRSLGLALAAAGLWLWRAPDEAEHAERLSRGGAFSAAQEAATRAATRAPLDWRPYFTRAGAEACLGQTLPAIADFRRAEFLEPNIVALPLEEGRFWMPAQPELGFAALAEALRRSRPPEDERTLEITLSTIPDSPRWRARVLALLSGRPGLQLAWFQHAPEAEARQHLEEIRAAAPQGSTAQRRAFAVRAAALEQSAR